MYKYVPTTMTQASMYLRLAPFCFLCGPPTPRATSCKPLSHQEQQLLGRVLHHLDVQQANKTSFTSMTWCCQWSHQHIFHTAHDSHHFTDGRVGQQSLLACLLLSSPLLVHPVFACPTQSIASFQAEELLSPRCTTLMMLLRRPDLWNLRCASSCCCLWGPALANI